MPAFTYRRALSVGVGGGATSVGGSTRASSLGLSGEAVSRSSSSLSISSASTSPRSTRDTSAGHTEAGQSASRVGYLGQDSLYDSKALKPFRDALGRALECLRDAYER